MTSWSDSYKVKSGNYGLVNPDIGKGHVFGTFPDGNVHYDPAEFERERDDGTTLIDLTPECRVFIFGGEVSKDIISVTINNAIGGNNCTIKLANPRGKYEISKTDLAKKWREDKDILSTYDYAWLERQSPDKADILKLFTSRNTREKFNAFIDPNAADVWGNMNESTPLQQKLFGGQTAWPSNYNITRMVYETKFFSGISKKVGDIIFDYRDPVIIFMKGRFSPYWYFAFTGVLVSWDESDIYEQEQTITLKCEDPLHFLKRAGFIKQGCLINAGNLSMMTRNVSTSQTTNIWQTIFGSMKDGKATTLDRALKYIIYGTDFADNVYNNHPIFSDSLREFTSFERSRNTSTPALRKFLEEYYRIGKSSKNSNLFASAVKTANSDFMTTWTDKIGKDPNTLELFRKERWTHQVQIKDIKPHAEGLNTRPLSPALPLYLQFNAIELDQFTGENLTQLYNASVRYWETQPVIFAKDKKDIDRELSGWGDGLAIGAAGIHPALTSKFIDSFSILPHVWKECWSKKAQKTDALENLVVSPHEKIRELVAGNPTESSTLNSGNHINLFRPRLFVVLPRKFLDKNRTIMESGFGNLQLFQPNIAKVFDCVKEICSAVEFNFYSSPMGDIFIEPEMYDFHPTEFVLGKSAGEKPSTQKQEFPGKIELRNIILKQRDVLFRATGSDEYGLGKIQRKDKAYFYNPKANHPFFLMEKDRIRVTKTFKPENIVTHLSVMGSTTGKGGVQDVPFLNSQLYKMFGTLNIEGGDPTKDSFGEKYYIADGFTSEIRRGAYLENDTSVLNQALLKLEKEFRDILFINVAKDYSNKTLETLFEDAADAAILLAGEYYDKDIMGLEWNSLRELLSRLRELRDNNILENSRILISKTGNYIYSTEKIYATINFLSPQLLEIMQENATIETPTFYNAKSINSSSNLVQVKVYSKIKEFLIPEESRIAEIYAVSTNWANKYLTEADKSRIEVKRNIRDLYLPIALRNPEIRKKYEDIIDVRTRISKDKEKAADVLTLGDLKILEQLGYYNPSLDMVRYYGYNPHNTTIKNLMIRNTSEAVRYARVWFNKLFGRAHQIHMEIIGRPEMLLNRPYYCEKKDTIGLLNNYSLNYSIGEDFQSSLDLIYIRPNAITYGYSKKNLDEIVGTFNNDKFAEAASNYYEGLADRTNLLKKGLGKIGGAVGEKLIPKQRQDQKIKETLHDIGEKILGYEGSGISGALYTAHDWIGHMEFDRTGREDEITYGAKTKDEITDPKLKFLVGKLSSAKDIVSDAMAGILYSIQRFLRDLAELEKRIDNKREEIINLEKELEGPYGPDLEEKIRNINSLIHLKDNYIERHIALCKHIYGYGGYESESENRIPSITELQTTQTFYDKTTFKNIITRETENVNQDSLYHKLLKEILLPLNIPLENIKLLDDRTVGSEIGGQINEKYVLKIGYKASLPLYFEPIGDWTKILEKKK